MKNKLVTETSISVDATPAQVWKPLTTPKLVKKILMGTNIVTDLKGGSAITYSGEHHGKKYHDKGIIKKIDAENYCKVHTGVLCRERKIYRRTIMLLLTN